MSQVLPDSNPAVRQEKLFVLIPQNELKYETNPNPISNKSKAFPPIPLSIYH
ncbi:hypothetical protein [Aquiflexum sp.]|uniref:hypothetical protein n=1 Tax=Aquiflexum sp. TaxID=1872584 RepID=UPI003593E4C0